MVMAGEREHTPNPRSVVACLATALCFCIVGQLPSQAQAAAEPACPPSSSATEGAEPLAPLTGANPTRALVACVGSTPILETTFRHWSTIAQAQPSGSKHQPSNAEVTVQTTMGFLISADWLLGEAQDLNIHVSQAEVKRTFDHIRKAQFPKQREFRAFLRRSKYIVPDLLLRVELNLLSKRIQQLVTAGEHTASKKKRALARFVSQFREKWTAQTYCATQYATQDCGHVQAAL
jgi:hypothetical protein